jgi:hypothetical protein
MTNKSSFIVIDTNVLISAGLLPESKVAQVLSVAVKEFVIAQNLETWNELETRISRPKFDRYFGLTGRLDHLINIAQSVQFFESISKISLSRDVTDDKFIRLALDCGANMIISGDHDLRDIQKHQDLEIISPAEFLKRFQT